MNTSASEVKCQVYTWFMLGIWGSSIENATFKIIIFKKIFLDSQPALRLSKSDGNFRSLICFIRRLVYKLAS
jgi:hypothetical protein